MNVLSLFDGMSCGRLALDGAGVHVENYFASDVDKYAQIVARENYPDTVQLGDVRHVQGALLPRIDLVIGGSPCQGFSMAGKRRGASTSEGVDVVTLEQYLELVEEGFEFDGESFLVWEYVRLLREVQTANPGVRFLLENVQMSPDWCNVISSALGVEPIAINSDRFVQQNRPRLYWTNIEVAELPERPEWSGEFYQWRRTYYRKNKSGVCPCLTANMGTGGHNVPLWSEDLEDKLTPTECERLQTVPEGYTDHVSNSQRYRMLGNGWTVDVIIHIFKGLKWFK